VKYGQTITLYPIGDIHLGSANCDRDLLFDTVSEIAANPDARWIGLGDYCEFISSRDRRFQAGGIDRKIIDIGAIDRICDVLVDKTADILRPIAGQCWGLGLGNHEASADAAYATALVPRILDKMGRPDLYLGWAAITRVVMSVHEARIPFRIFSAHGYQAGRKDGAKVNGLDDLMGYIDGCRIYLVGHSHSKLIKTKVKLSANQNFTALRSETVYGAHCGSFLRTYELGQSSYSERAGYPPTATGTVKFLLTPWKKSERIDGERVTNSGIGIEAVQ
jgi:hypothetical protein